MLSQEYQAEGYHSEGVGHQGCVGYPNQKSMNFEWKINENKCNEMESPTGEPSTLQVLRK